MSDDNDQDKTEDPTPHRVREAREEGNVPRSADLTSAALVAGLLVTLLIFGPAVLESWRQMTLLMLGGEEIARLDPAALTRTLKDVGWLILGGVAPIFACVFAVAVVANLAQVGFLYAPKKLAPNPNALNPIKGFGKIFGSAKTYVTLLMNLGKMLLAAAVAWYALEAELPRIVSLQGLEMAPAAGLGAWVVFSVGIKVALVLLLLAVLDYAYQRYSHFQELKMTKQQVKDEMKRMEGDPLIKSRRRQMAMQRAMGKIRSDVPTADVVVTNPTHFAVAIKYDEGSMHAPRVVAKGADLLAMRIRELATGGGVPIVERPPLARALYKSVEVGGEIPEDFYAAVAELLAYVYQLDRRMAAAGQE